MRVQQPQFDSKNMNADTASSPWCTHVLHSYAICTTMPHVEQNISRCRVVLDNAY